MNSISIVFTNPWLLLLLIPLIGLAFRPFIALPKTYRYMKKRIVSMAIHTLTIILLVLVVSGLHMEQTSIEMKDEIIILVDQSASSISSQDEIDSVVQTILEESPEEYKVGIIEFGKDTLYTVDMSTDKTKVYNDYMSNTYSGNRSATNIEEALQYAYDQLSVPEKGRIIVISDGRETDGNAYTKAKLLSDSGVRIDAYYITPENLENDLHIQEIDIPEDVRVNVPVQIKVSINSNLNTDANVTLSYLNQAGIVLGEETINSFITKGDNEIIFTYSFTDLGVTEVIATVDPAIEDSIVENNIMYGFAQISGEVQNKVLIIEGSSNDGDALEDILLTYSYEVDVISAQDNTYTLNDVSQYSGVVTINVKNSDLVTTGMQTILDTYVRDYGGGLLAIGGERAYQKEDMNGLGVDTTFSNLLPVESSTDPKAMAVVIVMDASSSMTNNGSTKLELAKQAAIASLEELASLTGETAHQFGLVTFDANLKDIIPLTSVEHLNNLIIQIEAIESGYGTQYTNGLQQAKDMLSDPAFANAQKHIIFLTDGGPQDSASEYNAVLNSLGDISLSSIALGVEGDNALDAQVVENMVRVFNGRGDFYSALYESQLQSIMVEDMEQAASGDFVNEVPFYGIFTTIIPELAGINSLPLIDGYYGTRAKIDSTIVIQTTEGDPLFALWNPDDSMGRVGSFTSDLQGTTESFSELLMIDFIGKALIEGMVSSVLPKSNISPSNISVGYIQQNNQTDVRIRADLEEGDVFQTTVTDPLGNTSRIALSSISSTTYSGSFETEIPGLYELEVTHYNSAGSIISETKSYSTFSYSIEYNHEFDEEDTISLMEGISENGSYIYDVSNIFNPEELSITKKIDITSILITISMALFLIDIIIRKFKFSWSNKYFARNQQV